MLLSSANTAAGVEKRGLGMGEGRESVGEGTAGGVAGTGSRTGCSFLGKRSRLSRVDLASRPFRGPLLVNVACEDVTFPYRIGADASEVDALSG